MAVTRELIRELDLIVAGEHGDPHRVLGLHDGKVRAYRPDAVAMRVLLDRNGEGSNGLSRVEMTRIHPAGVFEASVPKDTAHYRLEADYGAPGSVSTYDFDDPYRA